MMLLDGKALSGKEKERIAQETADWVATGGKQPHLAAVLVGEDGASKTYVGAKVKACEAVGFKSTLIRMEADITQQQLDEQIDALNDDPDIDGFIVQLPLPSQLDEWEVIKRIDPSKDVDGFHPENVGRMVLGRKALLPATPAGVMRMLEAYEVETEGKHAVVIGRSNIVGKPMTMLLSRSANPGNCTVTMAHSKTRNLKELCASADIIVAAVGRPEYVTADMVKEGAVVIDVGITRVPDESKKSGFRLSGDVDYKSVAPKCSAITPVPGGVGPMTIVSLLSNTLQACKSRTL